MTKILVTGGAGFIASCLIEKLVQDKDTFVVAVDNFLTGHPDRILSADIPNYTFIKGDANNYNDLSGIMLSWKFDYVFHYAAVVGVARTLENPVMVLEDITGIKNILQLSKNTGVKRIFFSSSSEVYGEPVEFPQNEQTTPLNSKLPYAIVKNIGEAFCRSYQQEYGLNFTLFRFFNTYGPKQSADFVMSRFIKAALKNEPVTIYGDGLQTRTFCFVDDNIDACITAFKKNIFVNDVVNIGNDVEITILHLAKTIIQITGSSSPIVHLPALKEGDMTRRNPDIGKMKQLLQRELTPIEEGIKHIIQSSIFQKINGTR